MGSVVSGIGSAIGKVGDVIGDAWGAIGGLGGITSGIKSAAPWIELGTGLLGTYADYQASKDSAAAMQQAMRTADPFGQYRKQFANRLVGLYQNPWTVADTPGYQFRLAQGLEGINRNAAAQGYLGSGNRLMELMRYGQDYASQEFDNEVARLAGLSGATMGSPGEAANLQVLAGITDANRFGNVLGNLEGVFDKWGKRQEPTSSLGGRLAVNLPGGVIMYQ